MSSESCSGKAPSRRLLAAGLLRPSAAMAISCLQDDPGYACSAAICCSRGGVRKQVRSKATAALPRHVVLSETSVWTTFAVALGRTPVREGLRRSACEQNAVEYLRTKHCFSVL